MQGWTRRGWDQDGIDCRLVMKLAHDVNEIPGKILVDARVFYGGAFETSVNLGRFMSSSLQTVKALVSAAAKTKGFLMRSDWSEFEEEFQSGGELW